MSHWHTILVERKDGGDDVALQIHLSDPSLATREAADEKYLSLVMSLAGAAAAESVREGLISSEEGVVIQDWTRASRKLAVLECPDDDCWPAKKALYDRLSREIEEETGKPVSAPPPPPINYSER
ncbi:hypothetical protein [Spirillospora sp. NPDC047279]|uniref:hypothetical protein n=1 Tax=Spirillospora sp. NPDC047279 TaxID=3155478 RepID=UPI0033FDD7F4